MEFLYRLKETVKQDRKCINGVVFSKRFEVKKSKEISDHSDIEKISKTEWEKKNTPEIEPAKKKRKVTSQESQESGKVEKEPESKPSFFDKIKGDA